MDHSTMDHAQMGHTSPSPTLNSHLEPTITPYLHTALGDPVWFREWIPHSSSVLAGACIGLAVLAIVERWVAAVRAMSGPLWIQRNSKEEVDEEREKKQEDGREPTLGHRDHDSHQAHINHRATTPSPSLARPKTPITRLLLKPFRSPSRVSREWIRGLLYAIQMTIRFSFMLTIMTYQAYFLLSVVVGLGIGEALFGRFVGGPVYVRYYE